MYNIYNNYMFFNKKNIDKTYIQRITDAECDIAVLKQKISSLELENEDLRNKVLRKMQQKRKEIETIEEQPKVINEDKPGAHYQW